MEQKEFKTPARILEKNRRWRDKNRKELQEKGRTYYQVTRDKRLEYKKTYYAKNREAKLERDSIGAAKRRAKQRQAIFEVLGDKCVRCGFNDWRALQVDHINGGGNQERKQAISMSRYYKDILLSPEKYQILCANCNQIKRYEDGEKRRTRSSLPAL